MNYSKRFDGLSREQLEVRAALAEDTKADIVKASTETLEEYRELRYWVGQLLLCRDSVLTIAIMGRLAELYSNGELTRLVARNRDLREMIHNAPKAK